MSDSALKIKSVLAKELFKAEGRGDLVISTSIIDNVTSPLAEAVKVVYAGIFTVQELAALSNLIFQSTSNEQFYDWEMPTLVGYTREEMQKLGDKLNDLSNNSQT